MTGSSSRLGIAAVQAAGDAARQIRAWAHVQTWHNPRSRPSPGPWTAPGTPTRQRQPHGVTGPAAGWRNPVDRPAAARGRTAPPDLDHRRGGSPLSELTSFHVWDDLVTDAQIPPGRYIEIITATALGALGAPLTRPDQQPT